ncbi:MAG: hypothetical protein RLZZ602_957 [Pseudomonadota bacterium]|jgi:triosephosphate isomerase
MALLVVANWKMNGGLEAIEAFAGSWTTLASGQLDDVTTVVCPPFPYLGAVSREMPMMGLGAQDCSAHQAGAYTGEVAAEMLQEAGCRWVIVGHSERRQYHGETDAIVAAKAQRGLAAGLSVILCVGESLAEREAGEHERVVASQLQRSLEGVTQDGLVIAYEPVWAIGTGRTATPEQANEMHRLIRKGLVEKFGVDAGSVPIIYGGSVKPSNAAELFACDTIDGALVGGASLEAESFWQIASAGVSGRK